MTGLQFERSSPPDIVPRILFIDKNLVDSASCPFAPQISLFPERIQVLSYLTFRFQLICKLSINFPDSSDFIGWPLD